MSLASPFWLLLLIPWLAAVVYLMLGKPPRQAVPFLSLWRGPEAKRRVEPSISKLPLWIALLLLAAGLAIVAAAGPGLAREAPRAGEGRLAISNVSARHHQVMVSVLNESSRRDARLAVADAMHAIEVPAGGRTFFFDIPNDRRELDVRLDGQTIHMRRRRTWPRVDARTPLPPALRRMIDTYAAHRPAGDDSTSIALAANVPTLGGQAGVILADPHQPRTGKVTVIDHPITRDINWRGLLIEPQVVATPPVGFVPLVRVGDQPVLAVRDSPRQVWVGFDTPTFARSPDFVIFWSNVLDFTGQGADVWEPAPGTVFASGARGNPVQKRVQNLAPWLAVAAVVLSAAGAALAPRGVT